MTTPPVTAEGLRPALGLRSAVLLVMGGMIGVGVFVNPAVVARSLPSGPLIMAAWALGGALALLGALVYGELAARVQGTGGEYAYLRETYGPLAGFLFGWTTLLVVHAGGMAAVAIVFAKNIDIALGAAMDERVLVCAVLGALALVNCLGVKAGDGAQSALGVLKVIAIFAVIAAGLAFAPHALPSSPTPLPDPLKTFGAAMIPVVFSYGGWQTAAYVAGELRRPERDLSRALVLGVLGVIVIYLLVTYACLRALGAHGLGATLTPTSDVLTLVAGPLGGRLAAGAIALSALAFLSQSMLTGPRVTFAMARDGLFFKSLGHVLEGARAPAAAILLLALWTCVLALSGRYEQILSYVTAMNFLFFGLAASSLFILRRRDRAGGPRPRGRFRTPLHPATTLLFILACALIVASAVWAYPADSLLGYLILLLGVPPYLYWRRRRRLEALSKV
jgi:APA family basic amino acid/polyamine antiporter